VVQPAGFFITCYHLLLISSDIDGANLIAFHHFALVVVAPATNRLLILHQPAKHTRSSTEAPKLQKGEGVKPSPFSVATM
jgi:hypothetical protein